MLSCPSGSIKVFHYNKIVLCRFSSKTFKRLARCGSIKATVWLPKVTVYRHYRPLKNSWRVLQNYILATSELLTRGSLKTSTLHYVNNSRTYMALKTRSSAKFCEKSARLEMCPSVKLPKGKFTSPGRRNGYARKYSRAT
jgi:hypothetical protein